jgi:hypothetical protein
LKHRKENDICIVLLFKKSCNVSPSILFGKGEYYLWGNSNFALDAFGSNPTEGAQAQWYQRGNNTQQLSFVKNVAPAPAPVVQQPVIQSINNSVNQKPNQQLQESGLGGFAKLGWAALGFIASRSLDWYTGSLTPLQIASLDTNEQYVRTDNWPWTNTTQYRENANRLACAAKIDRIYRTQGKTFDGPINFQHTLFERDGNEYKCSVYMNKDIVNDLRAKGLK